MRGPYSFVELDDNHWLPERRPEECAAAVIARVRAARCVERARLERRGCGASAAA